MAVAAGFGEAGGTGFEGEGGAVALATLAQVGGGEGRGLVVGAILRNGQLKKPTGA